MVFTVKLEAAVCSQTWTQNSWYLPDDGVFVSARKNQNVRRHISLNRCCYISSSSAALLQVSATHEPRDYAATSPTLLFSRKSKQITVGAVAWMLCVRADGNFNAPHSSRGLCYDRSIASSKEISPHSATHLV